MLEHLIRAREELLAAIEGLSETEMTMLPVAGVWTIKDILAHISGWAAWDLAGIGTILAGERPDFSAIQDVDTFNGRLVAERSTWSLDQVLAIVRETIRHIRGKLAANNRELLNLSGLGLLERYIGGNLWRNR